MGGSACGVERRRFVAARGVAGFLPALGVLLALGGCASKEAPPTPTPVWTTPVNGPALTPADPREYPDFKKIFTKDRAVIDAIDQSLAFLAKPSSEKAYPYQTTNSIVTHDIEVESLKRLKLCYEKSATPEEFAGWVLGGFDIYKSVGFDSKSGRVLFTAYYTPIFEGSRVKTDKFKYPLYRRPADLVSDADGTPRGRRTPDGQIVPYYTRSEIEAAHMFDGTECAWLSDPFEVYIVHVQGSARIHLADGPELNLGYAGKTDRPYESVGKALIKSGKLKESELSLARLRQYFRDHPQDVGPALAVNQSYVFFTEGPPGPFGSLGAKVTPYHTVATDKAVFPRAGPTVAVTQIPTAGAGDQLSFVSHTGLYLDQDTGGAIRSAGRADLYLGVGPEAERLAGHMTQEGKLFYLFAKKGGAHP